MHRKCKIQISVKNQELSITILYLLPQKTSHFHPLDIAPPFQFATSHSCSPLTPNSKDLPKKSLPTSLRPFPKHNRCGLVSPKNDLPLVIIPTATRFLHQSDIIKLHVVRYRLTHI